MKNLKYKLIAICSVLLLLPVGSCMDDDINRNKYEVDKEEIGRENYILGSTIKGMQGLVIPAQEHLYQFVEAMCGGAYGGYFSETRTAWLEKFSTYNPKSDWAKAPFTDVISETYPKYFEIMQYKEDIPVAYALASLLRISIMHRVTDIYGPIPYSKIQQSTVGDGSSEDTESKGLNAAYDSQEDVYRSMFKELEEIDKILASNISDEPSGFARLDDVYYGNLQQWRLFLHSLQLRMAMRLTYTDMAAEAKAIAEKAVAEGVIEKNEDNAMYHVTENRSALCFNDWKDYRIGADILCYMNGYLDPRLPKYFTKEKHRLYGEGFYGMRIGINSEYSDDKLIAGYSNRLMTAADPYVWMTAAEVAFLRSEGALRQWNMGGDAKSFYKKGVELSFEEHAVTGAEEYLNSILTPSPYQSALSEFETGAPGNITVKWNESSGDTFEENLERIITQKWIAIFPNGIEAWNEHRRTGYPKLLPVVVNKGRNVSTEAGMRRLMYPSEEYNTNALHLANAVKMLIEESSNNQAGDTGGTHVWWDKKPNK